MAVNHRLAQKTRKLVRRVAVSVAVLAGLAGVGVGSIEAEPFNLVDQAIHAAAERYNLKLEDLWVEYSATAVFPLTERAAVQYKILDRADNEIYEIALDLSGHVVDTEALVSAERSARFTRYGRLEPDLAARLETAKPDEAIPVVIWLQMPSLSVTRPEIAPDQRLSHEDVDAMYAGINAQVADQVGPVTELGVAKMAALGVKPRTARYAPVLYADLSPEQISTVASWPKVDTVYLGRVHKPEVDISRPAIGADEVHVLTGCPGNSDLCNGGGVKLGQVEVGGRVATANPNLPGVSQDTIDVCASPWSHATAVAGIIASRHSTFRGIAPFSTLRAAGTCAGTNVELQSATNRVTDWGARVINLSWGDLDNPPNGQLRAIDRFFDAASAYNSRFVVKSAGNRGDTGCAGSDGWITNPGLGYNTTTVGFFDTKRTDDVGEHEMHPCSSWRDPNSLSGDREKPEVVAPGTSIRSTTIASPWSGVVGSGTSYAAPMVTGAAGLLIDRDPSLGLWPEELKALLMATAGNLESGTERDGAGPVLVDKADDIVRGRYGNRGHMAYTCSTPTPLDLDSFYIREGGNLQVAVVWSQNTAYVDYFLRPSADLDLQLIGPSGTTVASSLSFDNTYERITNYGDLEAGTYRLRVTRRRCDLTPQFLGWAWYGQVGYRSLRAEALEVDTVSLNSDGNGVLEPGEQVEVAPAWRHSGVLADSFDGVAFDFGGPGGAAYTLIENEASYGTILPGDVASCQDTGVCYEMGVSAAGPRPAFHWDASFKETHTPLGRADHPWILHIGDSFTDVARTDPIYHAVESMLHAAVTSGCGGTSYCPSLLINRAQMTAFLLKGWQGAYYMPPVCVQGGEPFDDVQASNPFCRWIQELANRGVVSGCGGGDYCPSDPVTRAQMAVLVLKTGAGGGYAPPACNGIFTDVPCPSTFANWIEDLYNRGFVSGCSDQPLRYCPSASVTRGQMAVFISRAFGLSLYGPQVRDGWPPPTPPSAR